MGRRGGEWQTTEWGGLVWRAWAVVGGVGVGGEGGLAGCGLLEAEGGASRAVARRRMMLWAEGG